MLHSYLRDTELPRKIYNQYLQQLVSQHMSGAIPRSCMQTAQPCNFSSCKTFQLAQAESGESSSALLTDLRVILIICTVRPIAISNQAPTDQGIALANPVDDPRQSMNL